MPLQCGIRFAISLVVPPSKRVDRFEVAFGVASNAVRAPMGWSWATPFVHGTHGKTASPSVVAPRAPSVLADASRRSAQY